MGAGGAAPSPEAMAHAYRYYQELMRQQAELQEQDRLRRMAQDAYYARRKAVEDEFALREAERKNQKIIDCEFVVVDEKPVEPPR